MKIKELDNRKIVTDLLPVSSVISNTTLWYALLDVLFQALYA